VGKFETCRGEKFQVREGLERTNLFYGLNDLSKSFPETDAGEIWWGRGGKKKGVVNRDNIGKRIAQRGEGSAPKTAHAERERLW